MLRMSPGPAVSLIAWVALAIPIVLMVVISWKLFTGQIALSGLLYGDRANGETYFSPGRVQLLFVTVLVALQYLAHVVAHPSSFPPVPHQLLLTLGGSQVIYLGGKAHAMLRW